MRLRPLLEQALDFEDPVARAAFVAGISGEHDDLRSELAALVAAHAQAPAMQSPVAALAQQVVSADEAEACADGGRVGQQVDNYRLLRLLGSGGMGAVYLAERTEGGFRQHVALKLVRSQVQGGSVRLRFAHERQILAQLKHPNIAALLDGGETTDGAAYFTMEYVDGDSITEHCRERGLGVAARLQLLARVGAALAYAHRNLVVHRDIKPNNVLVDREGQVKLLDFGIAKLLLEAPGAGLTQHLAPGPMTPEYAAPEQFRGGHITAATDVYQFGVLMFRLLSGRLPYRADIRDAAAWAHAVTAEEPLRLAQALDTRRTGESTSGQRHERIISSVEPGDYRRLRRALRGDLEAIVRKALAKSADDRYVSMDALVADLEAVSDGRPVSAQRPSALYHLSRFVQRRRWLVGAFSLLLLALAASAGFAIERAQRAQQAAAAATAAADQARREAARARAMQEFIGELFQVDDPGINRGEQLSANVMLENAVRRLASAEFADSEVRADLEMLLGRTYVGIGEMRRAHARFEAALEAMRRAPAATPLQLGQALERSAWTASRTGQSPLVDQRLREARALAIPLDAASFPYHLDLLTTIGMLERDRGASEDAERTLGAALQLARRFEPTAGSDRLVSALIRHGWVLSDLARYAEAEQAIEAARAMAAGLFGDGDLRTVTAVQALGWLHISMGRLDTAAENLETARIRIKALVGERSMRYAGNAHNRGLLYAARGDHRSALAAFRESAEIAAEVAGPESLERGWALTNVGWTEARLGEYAAALQTFTVNEQVWRATVPPESPLWPAHHYSMARALFGLRDLKQAGTRIERSVTRYRQLGDGERFGLVRSLLLQAAILSANGDRAAPLIAAEAAVLRAALPEQAAALREIDADIARIGTYSKPSRKN
ncbi:MAG: serine/threonine protein kinase [Xanthomonadales bacterium]|nr:serine/threonine protein kinase [Xanthomonadales bacterium]